MPREFIDGFENGSVGLWETQALYSSTFVSRIIDDPCEKPDGMDGYFLFLDYYSYIVKTITARSEYYFSFLYCPTNDSGAESLICVQSGDTILGWIRRWGSSPYNLNYCRGESGTVIEAGSTEISVNSTYLVEVYIKIANVGGRVVVKIREPGASDSITDIDFTGDTQPGADTTINAVRLGKSYSTSYTAYACYDNFVCDSEDWIGRTHIAGLVPIAAGNSSDWVASSGNNHDCVNEVPVSDDNYIRAAAVDKVDTYAFESLSLENYENIKCVQAQCRATLDGTPTPTNINLVLRSKSVDYFSGDIAIPSVFGHSNYIWEADPKNIGSDLVTNGGFPSGVASWATHSSLGTYASVAGGQAGNCLEITEAGVANPDIYQAVTTVIGHRYIITLYVKQGTEATWNARVNGANLGDEYLNLSGASGDEATASWVQHTLTFTALDTTTNIILTQIAAIGVATTLLFDTVTLIHTPLWHLAGINDLGAGVKSKA